MRTFSGSDSVLIVAPTSTEPFGNQTWAVCVRFSSAGSQDILVASSVGGNGSTGIKQTSGATFEIYNVVAATVDSVFTIPNAEWIILRASKAAGTNPLNMSLYRFSTGAWTHEVTSGTLADNGVVTSLAWQHGRWGTGGGTGGMTGDMAASMYLPRNVGDREAERLARGLWVHQFDQPGAMVCEFPPSGRDRDVAGAVVDEGSQRGSASTTTAVFATGSGPPGFRYSPMLRRR